MKKTLLVIILQLVALASFAQVEQSLNVYNTESIVAIVSYVKNSDGFFDKTENSRTNFMNKNNIQRYYAYDKKNKKLYFTTDYGNYVAVLKDDYAKICKKSNTLPQLKEAEITLLIDANNKVLEEKIYYLNRANQEQIDFRKEQERQDSIRMVREQERQDSIRKDAEEKARLAKIERDKEKEKYFNSHHWNRVPTANIKIHCDYCEENIETTDTIVTAGANSYKIVWMDRLNGLFDIPYYHLHQGVIPAALKSNPSYSFHYEVFGDSLKEHYNSLEDDDIELYNKSQFRTHINKAQKLAPNGYFVDWEWSNEYSLAFNFKYRNTNKKTLKYIEVFWKAINPVGDVRNTGSFKGTGPVASWDAGRWEWDSSHYYLAGDVSSLSITKVIITYMDNTKVVVQGKNLRFN